MSKCNINHLHKLAAAMVMIVGLMIPTMMPAVDAAIKLNPHVLPPNSTPFGLTYGEWSARWWQFVFSIPAPDNPLLLDDKCDVGQSGKVWFLTGKFCVEESCATSGFLSATRSCTIPTGKAIFFPIANSESDNLGVDPPLSLEDLRAFVKANQDAATSLTGEVDGVSIQGLSNPLTTPYRVVSPVFDYTIPDDNIYQFFGLPFSAQTVQGAVADGVFLMLAPLAVGEHTIHLTAAFDFGFAFDITYNIRVVPGGASEH